MEKQQNPAHDSVLIINNEVIRVRRSFNLSRRIEEEFGALTSLVANMRVNNVTAVQLLWLVRAMLKDGENTKLSDDELKSWIEDEGPGDVMEQVGKIIYHLFMGNKKAEKFITDEEKEKEEEDDDPLQMAS